MAAQSHYNEPSGCIKDREFLD